MLYTKAHLKRPSHPRSRLEASSPSGCGTVSACHPKETPAHKSSTNSGTKAFKLCRSHKHAYCRSEPLELSWEKASTQCCKDSPPGKQNHKNAVATVALNCSATADANKIAGKSVLMGVLQPKFISLWKAASVSQSPSTPAQKVGHVCAKQTSQLSISDFLVPTSCCHARTQPTSLRMINRTLRLYVKYCKNVSTDQEISWCLTINSLWLW